MEYSNRTDVDFEKNLPFMEGKTFSEILVIDDDEIAKLEDEYFRTMEWMAWGR